MIKLINPIDLLRRYGGILYRGIFGRSCNMDKREAERLYDSGKESTVAKLLEYDEENERLKRRIAQLERDSKNSSKPPSSDNPQDKNPKKETQKNHNPKGRKPGGQPGHKGNNRRLIPVEEVDDLIHYYPGQCENCGKILPQDKTANEAGEPFRWQQIEIEPIKPTIVEHQCHTTLCECGCRTAATLPSEVGKSNFGPRLTAIIPFFRTFLKGKFIIYLSRNFLTKTSNFHHICENRR